MKKFLSYLFLIGLFVTMASFGSDPAPSQMQGSFKLVAASSNGAPNRASHHMAPVEDNSTPYSFYPDKSKKQHSVKKADPTQYHHRQQYERSKARNVPSNRPNRSIKRHWSYALVKEPRNKPVHHPYYRSSVSSVSTGHAVPVTAVAGAAVAGIEDSAQTSSSLNTVAGTPPDSNIAEPLTGTAPIPGPYELYGLLMCSKPGYKCISVKRGDSWPRLFPNERERDLVMRINRTNVDLMYRHWLVVPNKLHRLTLMDLSPFPRHVNTSGENLLYIDLDKYAFGAYDNNGNLVFWGPASGGADYCPEMHGPCRSATGLYRIYRKQGADCTSSEYPVATIGGAPMPYCMHYYRGYAIHGSTLTGFANRGRGCIRLFYDDAKWLNQNFIDVGTKVIVKQEPLPGEMSPFAGQSPKIR